jgi:hypothetical protein
MYPGKPRPRDAGPYGDHQLPRPPNVPAWTGASDGVPMIGPSGSSPYLAPARTPGEAARRAYIARISDAWRTHRK